MLTQYYWRYQRKELQDKLGKDLLLFSHHIKTEISVWLYKLHTLASQTTILKESSGIP